MPETMSPREKVAEQIYDRLGIGSENESVEQVSGEILAALASSGDHAELARLAEAAECHWPAVDIAIGGNLIAADPVGLFVGSMSPALVLALIAEVAALREDLNRKHEACQIAQDQAMENGSRAREAERKLAEAVGLLERIENMRPATCETSLAHDMAQVASEYRIFLSSKEAERG